MTEQLLIEETGPIMRATLNRPEKLNALTPEMFVRMSEAVKEFADRDDLRVFLIRAEGRYFCAGADLVSGDSGPTEAGSSNMRQWYRKSMGSGMIDLYDEIESIEKPFVVAHHAPCVGGGLELSLACDFRLAARSASYSFPETKLGSIPAAGGVSRFTRLCGPQWTKWILMADQSIDAERALAIGLVQQVWEDDVFEGEVEQFCKTLAGKPPQMTGMSKRTIDMIADAGGPEQARRIEILGQSMLHGGPEMLELFQAMQNRLGRKG